MTKYLAAAMVLGLSPPAAVADETWRLLFADAFSGISIDQASLGWQEQIRVFRERESLHAPMIDKASMRRILEIRYLRQADCTAGGLRSLSRAVFSEHGVLVEYEATRPDAAVWNLPISDSEFKLFEAVCAAA